MVIYVDLTIGAYCSQWLKPAVTIGSFMFIQPREEKHACQSEQWRSGTNELSTDLAQDS